MTQLETYYTDIWNRTTSLIKETNDYEEHVFKTLFDSSKLVSLEEYKGIILCETNMQKLVLDNDKEKDIIKRALNQIINSEKEYDVYIYTKDQFNSDKEKKNVSFNDHVEPRFNFDNFIVGESNKQAQTAAVACAYNPGKFFNPLFIYGDSGLGKTHLLCAIGNSIKKQHPELKVLYIQTYDFVSKFTSSASKNNQQSLEELTEELSSVDILLVDDVQFLSGKTKTNDYFFQIYNKLVSERKQIVLTSDKSPYELNNADIEDRLVSRFASGLTVTITSPEFNTRLEILKSKLKEHRLSNQYDTTDVIDDKALAFIATNCTGDVRKLEGILNQLLFYQIQFPDTSVKDSLNEILKTNIEEDNKNPNKIIRAVGDYYHITKQELLSKSRNQKIIIARHLAMYLCRTNLDLPFEKISSYFNNCDHTTVMSACKKIEKNIKEDQQYQIAIKEILSRL